MTAATLEEVLAAHGPSGFINSREGWVECECGERLHLACGWTVGGGFGEVRKTRDAHVAAAVRAWLADRLADEGLREAVARALAQMEPGEDWPTNEALGGGPTGTRDDEYRWAMNEEATAALAAVTAALTTPPPNPTTTEEPR